MTYPLPDEEDIETIRRELAQGLEERETGIIRQRLIDQYARGEVGMSALAPECIAATVRVSVAAIVQRGTEVNWKATRRKVFDRDQGVCHVCGSQVAWDNYECGHIIDRVCGGSDRLSNLVTMCVLCNRLKPMHRTRAEYLDWIEDGGWFRDVVDALT